jgi:hypothetical protein
VIKLGERAFTVKVHYCQIYHQTVFLNFSKGVFLGSGFLAIALFAERYTPTAQFVFGFSFF